jgi:hypothetical protein
MINKILCWLHIHKYARGRVSYRVPDGVDYSADCYIAIDRVCCNCQRKTRRLIRLW